MKKLLALLLAVVLMLGLVACGNSDDEDEDEDDKKMKITFEEQTVLESEDCIIKITGYEEKRGYGYLSVYLENLSDDIAMDFEIASATLNGVSCDMWLWEGLEPGKKANKEVSFSLQMPDDIGQITDIWISFIVTNSEDWSASPVARVGTHVYPRGEENAALFVREAKKNDEVLIDNSKIKLVITGYEEDDYGYYARYYVENNTLEEITLSVDDMSVNGYMVEYSGYCNIAPDSCGYGYIMAYQESLEENGIRSVDEMEFDFNIYSLETWENIADEHLILKP